MLEFSCHSSQSFVRLATGKPRHSCVISQHPNKFETTKAHSGSYGFGGLYGGDGDQVDWILKNGVTGSFTTIYLSWWEYTDPNAMYGTSDYFINDMNGPPCGSGGSGNGFNAQNPGSTGPTSSSFIVTGGNGGDGAGGADPGCQGQIMYQGGQRLDMMAGTWRQVEVFWTPNTTFSGTQLDIPTANYTSPSIPGCGNGEARLYINGALLIDQANRNFNGITSMANSSQEIGGVLTTFCPDGSRADTPGFAKCQGNAPTAFHRYFDDIIIIKK